MVGLETKKAKKDKQVIKLVQNETSPADRIPVIQVWWYVSNVYGQILAYLAQAAYLALIAYWSCKCGGGRIEAGARPWSNDQQRADHHSQWPVSDTVALRRGMTSLGRDRKRMKYRPSREFLAILLLSEVGFCFFPQT